MFIDETDKFLYFQVNTISEAVHSAVMYHVDSFLGFDCTSSDAADEVVNMRFKPLTRGLGVNQEDAGDVSDETDLIALTVTAGKQASVMKRIVDKLNEPVSRTGRFLVISDIYNGEKIHDDILNCVISVRTATAD
tara:strand:+ start:354 stop:758 length:405 start_codon:yes stop_codon:yes gene_type:complete